MLEPLREIHRLCLEHGDRGSAQIVGELLELHASDPERFWELLVSDTVWGGSGSLADQCLVSSVLSKEEHAAGRRRLWRALVSIADQMQSQGRVNVRTAMWSDAFRGWLRDGL